MLLTDLFPWLAQSPYAAQNHLPRVGTTHNEISPPSVISGENAPTELPTGQSDEDSVSRVCLPRYL